MIYLSKDVVDALRKDPAEVSFDLGRTRRKASMRDLEGIPIGDVRENFLYAWDGKDLYTLAIFDKHLYRLRLMAGKPILEMDGLRMHLVKDFRDVFEYSGEIVRILRICPKDAVLDTCTGLGYTAIAASRKAGKVITVEKSRAVLTLAGWNPWSRELFSSPNISIINGDSFEEIPKIKEKFTKIIHDPPRLSRAGNLYSGEFYRRLASASKKGALLFHYFGSLGKGERRISVEIKRRLAGAGWEFLKFCPRQQGCTARRV